jgi:hypothetical protein
MRDKQLSSSSALVACPVWITYCVSVHFFEYTRSNRKSQEKKRLLLVAVMTCWIIRAGWNTATKIKNYISLSKHINGFPEPLKYSLSSKPQFSPMLLLIWPYRSFLALHCCFFVTIYGVLKNKSSTLKWINSEDHLVSIYRYS